jgi:type IV pilus assembly protein PilY1
MAIDLGGMAEPWTVSTVRNQGAKTALVSSGGKGSPVVLALDVTQPENAGTYPIPLWEFDLAAFANSFNLATPPLAVDGSGGRHAPFIGRFEVALSSGAAVKWLALVGTDYVPNALTAGTLYFMDMATGQPLDLDTGAGVKPAVVPLEIDEGIAGEPIPVDVDANGTFDVIYVPSTSGKVWRISPQVTDLAAAPGAMIQKCLVADAARTLESDGFPPFPLQTVGTQRIHSNVGVRVFRNGPVKVGIYVGTADNPDDPLDAMTTSYFVLAYEDLDPAGTSCPAPASLVPTWVRQLGPEQRVWGGVSVSQSNIFVGTAIGAAADACNLDTLQSGALYIFQQDNSAPPTTISLGGHATSTPVLYDRHVYVTRVSGGPRVVGDQNAFNNALGGNGLPRTRVMMWDSAMDGKLPQ